MTIWEKITNALSTWAPMDVLIVATLVLIPLITVVLILVTIANGKKRKKLKTSEAVEEPIAASTVVAAPVEKKERRVRHITTNAPQRVKVRVRTKNLCKVDRSLLVATGIFGVGLGMMIHRAADGRR